MPFRVSGKATRLDKLPGVPAWQGTFEPFGVRIRCAVLEDGSRWIDEDDAQKFAGRCAGPLSKDLTEADLIRGAEQMTAFSLWMLGKPQ